MFANGNAQEGGRSSVNSKNKAAEMLDQLGSSLSQQLDSKLREIQRRKAIQDKLEQDIKKKIESKLEEIKRKAAFMQKRKIKRNYKIIKDMDLGNYFGEIGAISNLRRTSSVMALNSMLIGKIKISVFRDFMAKNSNF